MVETVTKRGEVAELRGGASGRPVGGGVGWGGLTELGVGHGAWRSGRSVSGALRAATGPGRSPREGRVEQVECSGVKSFSC